MDKYLHKDGENFDKDDRRSRARKSHSSSSKYNKPDDEKIHYSSNKKSYKNRNDSEKKKSKQHEDSSRSSNKKHSKQKKSKRSSSSSSSSSASSNSSADSIKLMKKLEQQRLKQLEERRRQKELLKATETPEEKRLRRLKKKEAKERKRKQRMGWDNDYLHYTNTDNPFGDGNLLTSFVWNKKMKKDGLEGVTREELEVRNRQKQEENKRELEKVKKRRQERELERQQREEEMNMMQRGKEAAQMEQWKHQEDEFHLKQARLRSQIRINAGRAEPIDLLAKYISTVENEEDDDVEMYEPYSYLRGLEIKDYENLIVDIKTWKTLERSKNLDYWNDITVIVEDEMHKLRKIDKSECEAAVGRREGINEAVVEDITGVFKGKSAKQLETMQLQIENKISGNPEGVDIGYWESLLSQLKAHMARARLRDRHQENLKKKLDILIAKQGVAKNQSDNNDHHHQDQPFKINPSTSNNNNNNNQQQQQEEEEEEKKEKIPDDTKTMEEKSFEENSDHEEANDHQQHHQLLDEYFNDYDAGGYSPKYISVGLLEPGTLVTLEAEDNQRLEFARHQVLKTGRKVQSVLSLEEQAMHREARKNMGDDEAQFSVESSLEAQIYLWSDKYRPRKPRYFNRVHTGFEWNKYNQTHYDMDNPPPKIVQGYKFNIFYPDLIDKSTTPVYSLIPCGENKDFAILKFHAGPPYEDIAFKIVNREWEYSYKRGFRCHFHNNIFQLWFHFKRYRYRR